jgi:hypothetical protein
VKQAEKYEEDMERREEELKNRDNKLMGTLLQQNSTVLNAVVPKNMLNTTGSEDKSFMLK